MSKAKYQFEDDFHVNVSYECQGFVTTIHMMLLQDGLKSKLQKVMAFNSHILPQNKRSCRKSFDFLLR